MIKPLIFNRKLFELERFQQNIYLSNRLNSAKPVINTNIFNPNSRNDFFRGSPKINSIFNNYITSFIYF